MISIIICTYNRDAYIYKTLECIAKNGFATDEYEVLLIDNNCTDNTVAECQRFQANYPNVPYSYYKETNQGLSFARNRGIQESHGDYCVFLDDDAYVQPDYLKNLKRNLIQFPETVAFGGKITPLYETGFEPEWISPRLVPIMSALDKGTVIAEFTGKSYPIGANMGFKKECFNTIGLFNTALGRTKKNMLGGEEKDIFDRLNHLNMKILYFPNVAVQHVIPKSRTTLDFLRRVAYGVGVSEQIRCSKCFAKHAAAILKECWKWLGSFALALFYLCKGTPAKSKALLIFRWNVTKGLLTRKKYSDD